MKLGELLGYRKIRHAALRDINPDPAEWGSVVVYAMPPYTPDSDVQLLTWEEIKRMEAPASYEEFATIGDLEEWAESFDKVDELIDYVASLLDEIK